MICRVSTIRAAGFANIHSTVDVQDSWKNNWNVNHECMECSLGYRKIMNDVVILNVVICGNTYIWYNTYIYQRIDFPKITTQSYDTGIR